MKKILISLFFFLLAILVVNSCKKDIKRIEPVSPPNPYDGVDYGNNPDLIPIDTSSFLGLHKLIFSPKCGVPACHDGAFEPDFRTIEGSYNQLVYHNVIKNDATNSFSYRVVPNDTTLSWLYERITTGNSVLGKMPLYDVLQSWQIKAVEKWIMDGAKDIFGNSSSVPNYEPSSAGMLAYLNNVSGTRLDTARDNVVSPIKLPPSSTVELWFLLYDSDASGAFIPGYSLTHNKVKISEHPFDFTASTSYNMTVLPALTPQILPLPFSGAGNAPYYQSLTINTSLFTPGKTYYIRLNVKDASGILTEIPEDGSPVYLSTYYAFIIQ